MSSRPDDLKIFQDCMTSLSRAAVPAIIAAYAEEWSKFNVICDVGGGHGLMLAEILKAAGPKAKGILYEVPEVLKDAPALLEQLGIEKGRVDCVVGDMFQSVPRGVDLYVMKHIIHDHDDDRCRKILKNCAAGLNRDGKILIMDAVIPGPNEPSSPSSSTSRCSFPSPAASAPPEFERLLASAGLRMTRVVRCMGPNQIIEAVIA
jgi:C-methyltransferase